jgi:hypothetical protein
MSVQFSRQAIAAVAESFPRRTSALVQRLVWARNDPGKERIRMRLLDLTDNQLRSALGLTLVDLAILRAGTRQNPPIWENNEGKIIPATIDDPAIFDESDGALPLEGHGRGDANVISL